MSLATPNAEPAFSQPSLGLREALQRLADVVEDEAEYDAEFLPPAAAAVEATRQALASGYEGFSGSLPPPAIAPVGDGGLLVQWKADSRVLRLLVPADPTNAYIYHTADGEDGVDPDSSAGLARWLAWLVQG